MVSQIIVSLAKGGILDMATVMKMVEDRRGDESYEDYAHRMGLKMSVLYKYARQEKGKRDMSIPNLQKMAQFYHTQGDQEMIEALASYAIGLEVKLSSS
jgi:cation transport regulator ChaB